MNKETDCNTTLGLGTVMEFRWEKQNKRPCSWLNLSLPIIPKIEANDHGYHDDHKHHDEKDDHQDSYSSKTVDVYRDSIGGSRKKLKLTTEQITLLEDSFKIHSTLNTGQKQELAKRLHLLPRQIEVWFQNRRARTKLKQIEQECALLKKSCETLTNENQKLKKELREARCCSLKFEHHQPPPF